MRLHFFENKLKKSNHGPDSGPITQRKIKLTWSELVLLGIYLKVEGKGSENSHLQYLQKVSRLRSL